MKQPYLNQENALNIPNLLTHTPPAMILHCRTLRCTADHSWLWMLPCRTCDRPLVWCVHNCTIAAEGTTIIISAYWSVAWRQVAMTSDGKLIYPCGDAIKGTVPAGSMTCRMNDRCWLMSTVAERVGSAENSRRDNAEHEIAGGRYGDAVLQLITINYLLAINSNFIIKYYEVLWFWKSFVDVFYSIIIY